MIQTYKKSDLNTRGRIFFSIPFLLKYCEDIRHVGDKKTIENQWVDKGYRIRIIHPVGLLIVPVAYILYFLLSMYDGGITQFMRDIKQVNDLFCFY